MAVDQFPAITEADEHGLLAIGGDLEVSSLLLAYRSGIFPWPFDDRFLAWFSPPQRVVLDFSAIRLSRKMLKTIERTNFTVTFNQQFDEVIQACAEMKNRKGQAGTWITSEMIEGYRAFHRAGYAHSIESWLDGQLVGGVYGVSIGSFFAGESMFYRAPNASKAALVKLIEFLKAHGVTWLDCQMMTPLMEQFGAKQIEREEYLERLAVAVGGAGVPFPR